MDTKKEDCRPLFHSHDAKIVIYTGNAKYFVHLHDIRHFWLKDMEYSAKQIAEILSGRVEGNPDAKISGFARIENGKPGTICFFANPKYESYVYTTKCDILIVNETFEQKMDVHPTLVRVADSYAAVAALLEYVTAQKKSIRRHRGLFCKISCSAKLGKRVYVGSHAFIGKHASIGSCTRISEQVYVGDNVTIGENCIIHPGVKIYPGMVIGNNVILHSGVVVGSDGFGFAPLEDGSYKKIQHSGNVIIEDDVEIGANTTIDKSQIGSTIIHKGVKIDNLCQIAHNVEIGENTVMAAMCGVAGSTKIGRNCMFGGQCGIAGHLVIPDRTKCAAKTAIQGSPKEEGMSLMGCPAIPFSNYMRSYAIFKNAPFVKKEEK